jgi:hypothetical protein
MGCTMGKQTPSGFISVDTLPLKITGNVLQKIPRQSMKFHYMMLRLVCGVRFESSWNYCMHSISATINSHSVAPFFEHCPITNTISVQQLTLQTILRVVYRVFLATIISWGLLPPRSPNLHPCDGFLLLWHVKQLSP